MALRARILILGGTGEAVALAAGAQAQWGERVTIITSLAGRTTNPVLPDGEVRVGGFGGSDGLAAYIRTAGIDAVVDATHPFARQISEHARLACDATGTPRLSLLRPNWVERPGDHWHHVTGAAAGARLLPRLGRRAFLAVGLRELAAFAAVQGVWFLVRLIERPSAPLPLGAHEVLIARGPFDRDGERDLFLRHRIDVLVTKASGGQSTEAKIDAARDLGLPVVMLRRPPPEPGAAADSVSGALRWLEDRLAGLDLRAVETTLFRR
jgi:precorrin-6A/cobalt-precorrin-6A reductase